MAREFTVYPVLNGWVVKIGCQMIAYTEKAVIERDISEYLTNPDKKEKEMVARHSLNELRPERAQAARPQVSEDPRQCEDPPRGHVLEKLLRR